MNPMKPKNPTARRAPMSVALATTIVLGGCASSLSGVGSTEAFACKAPIGAQCTSISGIYANANPSAARAVHEAPVPPQGPLVATAAPASLPGPLPAPPGAASTGPTSGTTASAATSSTPAALRSAPRVIRLWIAPWEDADGDLHEASFVHVVVDTGRWLIERVRPVPRSRLDIATPPLAQSPASAPPPEARSPADLPATGP